MIASVGGLAVLYYQLSVHLSKDRINARGTFQTLAKNWFELSTTARQPVSKFLIIQPHAVNITTSVTKLGNLLDFGQIFKAFGNN